MEEVLALRWKGNVWASLNVWSPAGLSGLRVPYPWLWVQGGGGGGGVAIVVNMRGEIQQVPKSWRSWGENSSFVDVKESEHRK